MVLRDTLSLYRDHQRDAGDTLAKAYQGGAYSKVRHDQRSALKALLRA